ncbi:MAG: cobalamin biosynthesis protein CobD [Lachnospiraceae bacterium]|nr:cobalamin biosynthesis protein CobD [Lachnospiraceae bacterium]
MFHKYSLLALLIGYLLDLIIGDPRWMWHPIRAIGWLISALEKPLRGQGPADKAHDGPRGVILVILVVLISTAIPAAILFAAYWINVYAGLAIEAWFCYWILATKSLKVESMKVYTALKDEGPEAGRYAVSMIVGRDTANLSEEGVVKAAVETVAENTADGVIAPMFYMAIGGAILGFFYKAVNTMDSMVGYKNDKYMYFGTAAAIFDDVVNFIPARLSAIFMIAAAKIRGMDAKGALRIFKRDRFNHASPNSAQTESVMAGALDVQLAGPAYYFGVLHEKKTIGDDIRPIEREDIPRANDLMCMTSLVGIVLLGVVKFITTIPFAM